MNKIVLIAVLLSTIQVNCQSFAPAAGQLGSTAIHKDSSAIVNWASGIVLTRGYLNIASSSTVSASFGTESDALGYAEGDGLSVVSFGDGGVATLTFPSPILNLPGPDFAVFENGFADNYMELAHVEVSSDGINFFRFPSISETPIDVQISNVMFSDCRYVNNLAGKYRQGYGTPFDLEELTGEIGLDVNYITHIRLIDVVGTIDPAYGTTDSQGNLINDTYPTEFESGGFDLDGVAVLHEMPVGINEESLLVKVFPNPANGVVTILLGKKGSVSIFNSLGQKLYVQEINNSLQLDLRNFDDKIFQILIESGSSQKMVRLIVD